MDPYVEQLLDAVAAVLPGWLERSVIRTSIRLTGGCSQELRTAAAAMAARCAPSVMVSLEALLATDVDRQQSNPLSVLRGAVRYPTELLSDAGLQPVRRDEFAVRAFPHDIYGISPATWTDIDESLLEPGLIWGAWKAKTVLDRRRSQ